MITNRDIIITGIQSWDIEIGSNCKNIALEFSRHNQVLYVNTPMDRMTLLKKKALPLVKRRMELLRHKGEALQQINERLWTLYPETILESINDIPFDGLFRTLNRLNNKRFAKQIRKAADQLGFKDPILFIDSDMFRSFHLKELLNPVLTCYYTRDNLLAVPFWQKHGFQYEPALMAKSDLVFANSTYLADLAARHNVKSHYVGQGCDLSLWNRATIQELPLDLAGIPKPIVGYTGALYALRLDVDILRHIAKTRPDWSVVLIGPEDETFRNSDLHQLPNVHFLGNKDPETLQNYVNGFDVAINPQKLNEVTRGNYPRKVDEYLALGKPTVCTKTEAMSIFAEHTYLATNPEEYVHYIEKALTDNTKEMEEARERFARGHSWENNVLAMYEKMELEPSLKTSTP